MATITPNALSNVGTVVADGNTAVGGDEFVWTGKPLLVEFINGHTADITVTFAPATAGQRKEGVGTFTAPTRALAVTANGGKGDFLFTPDNVGAYLNSSGRIAVAYTGHNAALKQRAFVVS
jgi:hypothetical protein